MSDERECDTCGAATSAFICTRCRDKLIDELRSVAWLADELEVTITRRAKLSGPTLRVAGDPETALPFNEAASEAAWLLRNVLVSWVRDLCDTRGMIYPLLGSASELAGWLASYATSIQMSEAAHVAYDEITDAVAQARMVIDRPKTRQVLGTCLGDTDTADQCQKVLYVAAGRQKLTCGECGTVHNVAERRDWMLQVVRNERGTAADVARKLGTLLEPPVKAGTIRQWHKRGKLEGDALGEFLFGDVIDLHVRMNTKAVTA